MFGKVICVPFTKGGYLDFWGFIKDDGRQLTNGAIRAIVHTRQETFMNELKKTLRERKRDLVNEYYKMRKQTASMRWYKATKDLYQAIKDTETERNIKHTTDL